MQTILRERRERNNEPDKGRWKPFYGSAMVGCPRCGGVVVLPPGSDITEEGLVTPAVHCTARRCRFMDALQLEGWAQGSLGTSEQQS